MKTKKTFKADFGNRRREERVVVAGRSRDLGSIEDLMIECQELFPEKFYPVHIMTPGWRARNVFYASFCFRAAQSEVHKLQERVRQVGKSDGLPGEVVLYRDREGYYVLEMKPFVRTSRKQLIADSTTLAQGLLDVLKQFYGK